MAAPAIDGRVFRDSVGEFATGVTVVTAEHDGGLAALPVRAAPRSCRGRRSAGLRVRAGLVRVHRHGVRAGEVDALPVDE